MATKLNIWRSIFIAFSIVVLSCAIKNFLIYIFHESSVSHLISPSFFGSHSLYVTPGFIEWFYDLQSWIALTVNSFVLNFYNDRLHLFLTLFYVPIVEEIIYRGPLFLLKDKLRSSIWWSLACLLSAIFAHSHYLFGLALLPLFSLGICSTWLLKRFHRFWPCIVLHFLYNFYIFSYTLYQSLFWGD